MAGDPVPDNRKEDRKSWVTVSRYWEMGFIIPSGIVVGFAIGKLLDYWLQKRWFTVAGVVFGAIAGFIGMIRMAISATKD